MQEYRTHLCHECTIEHVNQTVKLSGWIHRKRDHGNLLFIDLRDHYGITQIVCEHGSSVFPIAEKLSLETVISIEGKVIKRSDDTINTDMKTGLIEIDGEKIEVLSEAAPLPIPVNHNANYPEDMRLTYRFLDLRREELHENIILRAKMIQSIRNHMTEQGFLELQTPILTASSPEGARDFLVPSRLHPGKFYALPQAPQQFKQLFMVAGFDRYFQIAPCFRDEDARADRSPGEFYQLDMEMSFVTQEDVFAAIEPVFVHVFNEFSRGKKVSDAPFQRITYKDAMEHYGSDKPDLRNPLRIKDTTEAFKESDFKVFAQAIDDGSVVKAIVTSDTANNPRSFFDKLNDWARKQGQAGLGYISIKGGEAVGPIAKNLRAEHIEKIKQITGLKDGDSVFFVCGKLLAAQKFAGMVRQKLGHDLNLIAEDRFDFCWIVDFPMYEYDEELKKIDFSHNPFSMPQGGMEALQEKDPLDILAYQYDIVCNGIELSSGAIRNHVPNIMIKAFEIAGYDEKTVEAEFGGMLKALRYGAPPHGGCAPGIDRMVMLLAQTANIREVTAFPMNQNAEDLLMGAPAEVSQKQLDDVHIKIVPPL